jgi:hypothetical protein
MGFSSSYVNAPAGRMVRIFAWTFCQHNIMASCLQAADFPFSLLGLGDIAIPGEIFW